MNKISYCGAMLLVLLISLISTNAYSQINHQAPAVSTMRHSVNKLTVNNNIRIESERITVSGCSELNIGSVVLKDSDTTDCSLNARERRLETEKFDRVPVETVEPIRPDEPAADGQPIGLCAIDSVSDVDSRQEFGHLDEQLAESLNSEGDSVAIAIKGNIGIPLPVPSTSIITESGVSAQITKKADGYDVVISREAALKLGVTAPAISADGGAGVAANVIYHYDTLEEAEEGIKDLAITGGDELAANAVASSIERSGAVLETGGDVAGGVGNVAESATDKIGGVGEAIGGFKPNGVSIPGQGIVENVTGATEQAGDRVKQVTDDIEAGTDQIAEVTAAIKQRVNQAKENLNESRSGFEIITKVEGNVGTEIGLGSDVTINANSLPNVSFAQGVEVKWAFDEQGRLVSIEGTHAVKANGQTGSVGGVGLQQALESLGIDDNGVLGGYEGQVNGSASFSQEFTYDEEGNRQTKGEPKVKLALDVEGQQKESVTPAVPFLTHDEGQGATLTYEGSADDFKADVGNVVDVADGFVTGGLDTETARLQLADVQGEVSTQSRVTCENEFAVSIGTDKIGVGGDVKTSVVDQGEKVIL